MRRMALGGVRVRFGAIKSWLGALTAACVLLGLLVPGAALAQTPVTVAEASGYTRTGTGADVEAFLRELAGASRLVTLDSLGTTAEGREIPMAIIADPPVKSAAAARRSGRLIALAFGNIHAGEVCGKEALQMLARELTVGGDPEGLLDRLVVVVVPNYNADGNERMAPGNRPGQNGPEQMGTRANAQGLDLNRDWAKLDAPETRAFVSFLNEWDPHVVIDTHTTNGSLHRHVITYQGPKHPAGDPAVIEFVRDTMLPAVDERFERATGWKTFFYGSFSRDHSLWTTYPAEPRYGVAYRGLRNRVSVITEAYAYATFEDRVKGTLALVREILRYSAENASQIMSLEKAADERAIEAGRAPTGESRVAVRVRVEPFPERVTLPGYEETRGENGRPVAGAEKDYSVEFVNNFVATESVARPYAYLIPAEAGAVVAELQRHGIEVEVLREDLDLDVERYRVTGVTRSTREQEGHERVEDILVDAIPGTIRARHGLFVVRTGQKLGTLAAYLLEPRATDGLAAWNRLDPWLQEGEDYPVIRVPERSPMTLRSAPDLAGEPAAPRRLGYEEVFGRDRVNLSGSPVRPRWVDDKHYLLSKDGELRLVRAATGRSEPYTVDVSAVAERLAALPSIDQDSARAYAERLFSFPDPTLPGRVFEHAGDLYFAGWDGSGAARLTSTPEPEELAELSPDGHWVGFVRENDLYAVDLATRAERRLTTGATDWVRHGKADWVYFEEVFGRSWKAWWWSPDSSSIGFFITDSTGVPEFIIIDDKEEPQRVERTRYPKPGQRNPHVEVGFVPVAGGDVRTVDLSDYDEGAYIIGWAGWSVATNRLRLAVMDRAQTWLDLLEVGARGGEPRRLFRETTAAWVSPPGDPQLGDPAKPWNGGPQELSDGSFLWLSERDGWQHVYRFGPDGSPKGRVTQGDFEVRTVHFIDEAANALYFTGTPDASTQEHLYRVPLDGSAGPTRLTPNPGSHSIAMSPAGTSFIATWSDIDTPTKQALYSASGSLIRVIDDNPVYELAQWDLPRIERHRVRARRGVDLEAMLFLPPGFDPDDTTKTYPVWFMTYAGPHAPQVTDAWRGGWLTERALASQGVVVFRADPYSASGKGAVSAWTAYKKLGQEEMKDIEDLIAWVTAHPWADPARVGMSGHSYGGFMTAYAMTHSKLFSAGISGAPVTGWRDYDSIYTERYMHTPQNNPEGYDATDVVSRAADLSGNLLLLHGTMDDNVHMQNSIKLIDALTRAGKPFDVFFYPGFRHGLGSPHYQRLTWDFMLEQMRPTPPRPPSAEPTPEPSQSPAAQPGVAGPR